MKEASVSRVTWKTVVEVLTHYDVRIYLCFTWGSIHSKRISVCVLSETGQVVRRTQVRTIEEMMRILEGLPDRFEVCYEACCG